MLKNLNIAYFLGKFSVYLCIVTALLLPIINTIELLLTCIVLIVESAYFYAVYVMLWQAQCSMHW